jgi:hypothetical protein
MVPKLISADEIKKEFEGYDPCKVEVFHRRSTKIADKRFEEELKKNTFNEVVLMCGGTAAGKTEFLSEYLNDFDGIVFDGTLSTKEGAEIKIKNVLRMKKKPIVCAVLPDSLKRAFVAFLHRDRKFKDDHFYKTHSGSMSTLLWITKNFPNVEMRIYESSYSKKHMTFSKLVFPRKEQLIEFLEQAQYTEKEIINLISQ